MTYPKWRVAADGMRIEKVTADGEVIEAPKTRYGTQALVKAAAASRNRADRAAAKGAGK